MIRAMPAEAQPRVVWPGPQTIRRRFRAAGLAHAPAGRRAGSATTRAEWPHPTWQIDASEHIRLTKGAEVCWLRIVDEATGAVLGTEVSPHGCWTRVAPHATQATRRRSSRRWGRPQRLRGDDGAPWGSRGDPPTDPVCWRAGPGVAVLANPPCRPQADGVVQRGRGVGKRWCEPWTCRSGVPLQRRLKEMDRVRRAVHPVIGGRSRLATDPGLRHSGRTSSPAREDTSWDLQEVWDLVGTHRVPRQADRGGTLSVHDRPYSVGVVWAGRTIRVGFDPLEGRWTFRDEHGHEIGRQTARELSREAVCGMEVTHRRDGVHAAKPTVRNEAAKPAVR